MISSAGFSCEQAENLWVQVGIRSLDEIPSDTTSGTHIISQVHRRTDEVRGSPSGEHYVGTNASALGTESVCVRARGPTRDCGRAKASGQIERDTTRFCCCRTSVMAERQSARPVLLVALPSLPRQLISPALPRLPACLPACRTPPFLQPYPRLSGLARRAIFFSPRLGGRQLCSPGYEHNELRSRFSAEFCD